LLLLAEAFADDLIDRGFDKPGADPFPAAVALAVIGDEALIVGDIRVELLHSFQGLPCCGIAIGSHRRVEVHLDRLYHLERFVDIAVPEKPFEAFQFLDDRVA
jgi:hypothetical protein